MWLVLTTVAVVAVLGRAGPLEGLEDEVHKRVTRDQPTYGITHLDIRDAILVLDKSIKAVANKLYRHEAREAQLADFSTKTLNALSGDNSNAAKSVASLADQLGTMEERLLSLEALIHTTDERQRLMLSQMSQGLDRLLVQDPNANEFSQLALPNAPEDPTTVREVKKLSRRVNQMDNMIEREMRSVQNEVKIVGESLGQHLDQIGERHDRLAASLDSCSRDSVASLQEIGAVLTQTAEQLTSQVPSGGGCSSGASSDMAAHLDSLDQLYREQEAEIHHLSQETQKSLEANLEVLMTLLKESHLGQALINASVADLSQSLRQLDTDTQDGLVRLDGSMQEVVKDETNTLKESVTKLEEELKEGNDNILSTLDDSASQAETLQNTVLENYNYLSAEISSLKKVEQVMINTADAVLDTKRSIEYGIQQIIFELGDIVKNNGLTINSTLHTQISNISFAILKNQTTALTNMTAKMEQEISQVWRQIGIMYQQMTQSVSLLDELSSTTKQHMNVSLARVGDMDGTVGQINTKVADVESNLNYLLGRLSLVVSEFNLMKAGVGDELVRLRENLARENNPVQIDEQEPSSDTRYEVNRKRHAIPPPSGYFEQPREPLSVL